MTSRPPDPAAAGPRPDDGAPHTAGTALDRAATAHLERLQRDSGLPETPSPRATVRDLVVVASSSRGGSSLFVEYLKLLDGLLHFQGEINPFLRLCGLARPRTAAQSDRIDPAEMLAVAPALDRLLARDWGLPDDRLDTPERLDRYALVLAQRLVMQWPRLRPSWAAVRGCLVGSLDELQRDGGWTAGHFGAGAPRTGSAAPRAGDAAPRPDGAAQFHSVFLRRLRTLHPEIDPHRYDLPPDLAARIAPDLPRTGAPPEAMVEEPPFILPRPWRPPTDREAATLPLVIKTPSNAYRLAALRALFPRARFRVLHLTRNPMAAINGLIDGWQHSGFFSCELQETLAIAGYSDRRDAWAQRWWKFDLPPGWASWRDRPLAEVAGLQWGAAHRATLDYLRTHPEVACTRVRFEDLIADAPGRLATFEDLSGWLGASIGPRAAALLRDGLPPVMATRAPAAARWRARAAQLEPLLREPQIARTARELGYVGDPAAWP